MTENNTMPSKVPVRQFKSKVKSKSQAKRSLELKKDD